jgi:hypothetical protein
MFYQLYLVKGYSSVFLFSYLFPQIQEVRGFLEVSAFKSWQFKYFQKLMPFYS